ncbi:restriction endonuclease [Sphingorhabdus lutea]|uniref:Restriction endonuclease n=1 Tax=Sphingorhabdus lutea TaxID=1913578 RepID=A0A1L3JA52_9SPHN|nr:DEAD/DEAH box helicase family protein [Sphingorhabdus lutea]APG62015.1 restriction endonuclease [Sphingorhabdus lutea]
MNNSFFEEPILNSPYMEPSRHHALDDEGQPTDQPPIAGRRPSALLSPVPKPKKRRSHQSGDEQQNLKLYADDGISSEDQEYNPTPIINDIRSQLKLWRSIPNPQDWGVTPATARLLQHWRSHEFQGIRPFFCQVEAVETIIWLTEVARKHTTYKRFWNHIESANAGANPELLRLAMKMATGAGKTTVMAMLIAWQTINAVRSPTSKLFTRGFLIVAPGITIKDRLRVLQPSDPDSYYESRELVPADMQYDLAKAKIVITNYHAFQLRELMDANKTTRSLLQGRAEPIQSTETEGQMVRRVADELMGIKNIVVINDEAHHCYREKPDGEQEKLTGDERKEAEENSKAARLWINGIEAFKRKLGVRAVYDLSATPFFLSGSGWAEGTLFPWTISDFSLMDAIECGIVKLPRIPVDDNIPGAEMPIYRNLWDHIGKDMPKKGGQTADPLSIPDKLKSALKSLYGHYKLVSDGWEREGIDVPPVFIVVCNNTTTSKLVYEWISGWQRENEDGDLVAEHYGHLEHFSNFDQYGEPLAKPNTLLIDSQQIESGELDKNFREMAAPEIEKFKRERKQRGEHGDISDSELLREVMNTVGKKGRLGEKIRCVVSVSMLTEGWDTNTVTHILGVRAFGTQLLCEQVVGRGLRRLSYELNEQGLFDSEYADILGIPFNFTAKPVIAPPKAPKKTTHVKAMKEREALEIRFPRVIGYRVDLPEEQLVAEFTEDSILVIDHDKVGASQTDMSGIVGESHTLSLGTSKGERQSTTTMKLAKTVVERHYRDADGAPKWHLVGKVASICRRWMNEGYLKCPGDTAPWMLSEYPDLAAQAAEKIANAISRPDRDKRRIKAVMDPYNPLGSTRHVSFTTTKDVRETDPRKCHVNYVVSDSDWEAEFARVAENHPKVLAYVKNQGLGFAVPYKDGEVAREYVPDFIVQIDDGRGADDPLNLIIEIKGMKNEQVKLKKETMLEKWVPGVNILGVYGRWAFDQFDSVFEIESDFRALIERALETNKVSEVV